MHMPAASKIQAKLHPKFKQSFIQITCTADIAAAIEEDVPQSHSFEIDSRQQIQGVLKILKLIIISFSLCGFQIQRPLLPCKLYINI